MRDTSVELVKELSDSYLEYSLAAITRAIPDYRDGFIPIYRRVLWAAYKGGFTSDSPTKKSARLDGEIIGKYSPHGSAYGSIVTLASAYNYNYPLLEGQGNFGSSTDGPAASRYTECRLMPFAEDVILQEIDTLDYKDNYDGSRKEPIFLNAKLPMLMIRGATSIGVGYATNISQYNLREICSYLLSPSSNTKLYPDFPTGPDIFISQDGKIKQRAKIQAVNNEFLGTRRKKEIIIVEFTNLPYGGNPEKIGEQIKNMVVKGLVPNDSILKVDDLSDRNGDCVAITILKSQYDFVLSSLYKYTDLENTYSLNFTVLVDGLPKTLTPEEYLNLWRVWRIEQIRKHYVLQHEVLTSEISLLTDVLKILTNRKYLLSSLDKDTLDINDIAKHYSVKIESVKYLLSLTIRKLSVADINDYKKKLDEYTALLAKYANYIENPTLKFKEEIKQLSKAYGVNRKSSITTLTIESVRESTSQAKVSPKKGFSIDLKTATIKTGNQFNEKMFLVCSNGLTYTISPTMKRGPIAGHQTKVLYIIPERERASSSEVLEILDKINGLAKRVRLCDLVSTSKGTKTGFNLITKVVVNNNPKSQIPLKSKIAKPAKIKTK